jgi:hypothetical protein
MQERSGNQTDVLVWFLYGGMLSVLLLAAIHGSSICDIRKFGASFVGRMISSKIVILKRLVHNIVDKVNRDFNRNYLNLVYSNAPPEKCAVLE